MLILLLCASLFIDLASAYSNGPPIQICRSMFPIGHEAPPHTHDRPFVVMVNKHTYTAGEELTVTVSSSVNTHDGEFRGLFVQARLANCSTLDPIGAFKLGVNETYLRLMSCMDKKDSAVSHMNSEEHTNVSFTWVAPDFSPGHIFFTATVVHERTEFWIDVQSDYVNDTTSVQPFPDAKCVTPLGPLMPPPHNHNHDDHDLDHDSTGGGSTCCACPLRIIAMFLLALSFYH